MPTPNQTRRTQQSNNTTPSDPPPAVPHEQDTIEELQARMVEVHERGNTIRATADAEHRMLSDEETRELDGLSAEFEQIDAEVQRRERLTAQRERLARPQPRVTQPADPAPTNEAPRGSGMRITGGEPAGATKGSWGWRNMGEFSKGIVNAAKGQIDPRLVAAATTYGNETTNADGGYAVPPDFRETIVKKVEGEDSLLARTDQQFTSSNKITLPKDTTTPWQDTGGIQAYWGAEGATKNQSKPALGEMETSLNKLYALVPVTDELLEDVPSLNRYIPNKVADKFTSKINQAIIEGDGTGKPEGLLNAGSAVTVAKETGQAAETLVFENVVKMWARLYAPLRRGAIWLVNQDIEPQMYGMMMPGGTFPAYIPPGGLSAAPYATLLGRPVIPTEFAEVPGTVGDIILTNLSTFLSVQKVGGIKQDVSIHCFFDQDITAFRFVMRIGGQSWWTEAVARAKGSNTLSNIVLLAERA